MALSCQKIDVYASSLEESGSPQQFVQLAEYFNNLNNHADAGKFYGLAKDYDTVNLYLLKRVSIIWDI
jgi:hypothetical protein